MHCSRNLSNSLSLLRSRASWAAQYLPPAKEICGKVMFSQVFVCLGQGKVPTWSAGFRSSPGCSIWVQGGSVQVWGALSGSVRIPLECFLVLNIYWWREDKQCSHFLSLNFRVAPRSGSDQVKCELLGI